MNLKDIIKISSPSILLASLCCLAPIVLVLLGITTVSAAAALTNVLDGQFLWLFILIGIVTLILSLVIYFRKKGICTLDQAKREKNKIINTVLIVSIISVIGFYLFFYVFLAEIGKVLKIWQ